MAVAGLLLVDTLVYNFRNQIVMTFMLLTNPLAIANEIEEDYIILSTTVYNLII